MLKIKNVKELFIPKFPYIINNGKHNIKQNILYFLNLSNFHIYEQLLIEECLYRMTPILTGGKNNIGFLIVNDTTKVKENKKNNGKNELSDNQNIYSKKSVVLGISGKVNDFLKDKNYAIKNNICLIKRFTGGGTIYINKNCLLVSLILPHSFAKMMNSTTNSNNSSSSNMRNDSSNIRNDSSSYSNGNIKSYKLSPSNITDWSFHSFYGKFMNKQKNNLFNLNFGTLENDYVLKTYDERIKKNIFKKVGGNAQAFSKDYFVHHSSFLWFCNFKEVDNVLVTPKKQPLYRKNRNHNEFIDSVKKCLKPAVNTPDLFITNLVCHTGQIVNELNEQMKMKKKKKIETEAKAEAEAEEWSFRKISLHLNEDLNLSKYFLSTSLFDIQLLKELYYSYINNSDIKHLRTTHFVDINGNKVCDNYYNIPYILLT